MKDNVLAHLDICWHANITHDSRSFYRNELNYHEGRGQCHTKQGVLIQTCSWRTRTQIKQELLAFIDDEPELIGWCCGYDFVVLCQIFGTMMDVPRTWPHYMVDIQHVLDELGATDDMLPRQEGQAHNALADARYIHQLWKRYKS